MSFPCQILKQSIVHRIQVREYCDHCDAFHPNFEYQFMPQTFVTFGQRHAHNINGQTVDCDTVAVIQAPNAQAGREAAFQLFGPKFSMEYHDKEWNETNIKMFPKGYVYL